MGKKLYLECYSGISGDMTVAALLDLGADAKVLDEALKSLPVQGFETKISRVKKSGLDACDFDVILDEKHENHDHDMEYLHGHEHSDEHHHHHHEHEHDHDHGHHHHHEHRGLADVLEIINAAKLTDRARAYAIKTFEILGEAEAKAHGTTLEEVHFHEVGAVDSIVDIVAAAVCMDNLDVDEVIVPALYEGCGTVRCAHGILPIPVPAVANIIAANHLNVSFTETKGEFITPTGAALVAAFKTSDRLPNQFSVEKIGLGAGKRNYERPSIVRAMIILDSEMNANTDEIWKLESNIDDCTGEALGYCMERLMEAGARDVNFMPIYMKKNRPAYQLNVICKEEDIDRLSDIIFRETTTIGIRRCQMERTILDRTAGEVSTAWGDVKVKICSMGAFQRVYPEYESVKEVAAANGVSFKEVYDACVK